MKNKNIYLDTNIVADIIDTSRSNHKESLYILEYLAIHDYKIFISEDMLTTLYYILKDKKQTLEFLKNLVFIDWEISKFGKNVIKDAIDLSLEKDLDLEDVLQCLCAKENQCSIVITNDKNFYDCDIDILESKEFIKKIEKETK